jgi:hypothetical protein
MALGKCPECDGNVSTTAEACPHCGNVKFRVPTGKTFGERCNWCAGLSRVTSCPICKGARQVQRVEVRDLRDGSIHVERAFNPIPNF